MRPWKPLLILLLAAAALNICAAGGFADESGGAAVDEVSLRREKDILLVDFSVKNAISTQLTETLDSGLPVRFVYNVRLVRKAGALTSGTLSNIKFERVLEKDNLKNRYRISEKSETSDVGDLNSAVGSLCRVVGLEVAPLLDILPEKKYQVEIQVKLEEFRLPFHLHQLLPFLSLWDQTTPWKIVRLPQEILQKP